MKNSHRILVVDDEPDNFDVIEALLNNPSYQLDYVSSGQRALEQIDVFQPDVILLDVMMPDLDGIEVCKRIKAIPKWKATPIVMVTALTSKEDLALCLQAGADDFISKPVNGLELRARVHSMLRIKKQHDDLQALLKLRESMVSLVQKNLEELKHCITYSLPHEFNTPMNVIVGSVDLLLDDYEAVNAEENLELLQLIKQSTHRMNRLVQNFLIHAHLELVETDLDRLKRMRNDQCFTPVQILIIQKAKEKAKEWERLDDLSFNLEEVTVWIRIEDLNKITEELLDNAFKFSVVGTPVKVMSRSINNNFHLSVSNQGRGMTQEQIAKIGPYRQFDRKRYEQQGAGLGLAIVKGIAKLYQGQVAIDSKPDEITKVTVVIPRSQSSFENQGEIQD